MSPDLNIYLILHGAQRLTSIRTQIFIAEVAQMEDSLQLPFASEEPDNIHFYVSPPSSSVKGPRKPYTPESLSYSNETIKNIALNQICNKEQENQAISPSEVVFKLEAELGHELAFEQRAPRLSPRGNSQPSSFARQEIKEQNAYAQALGRVNSIYQMKKQQKLDSKQLKTKSCKEQFKTKSYKEELKMKNCKEVEQKMKLKQLEYALHLEMMNSEELRVKERILSEMLETKINESELRDFLKLANSSKSKSNLDIFIELKKSKAQLQKKQIILEQQQALIAQQHHQIQQQSKTIQQHRLLIDERLLAEERQITRSDQTLMIESLKVEIASKEGLIIEQRALIQELESLLRIQNAEIIKMKNNEVSKQKATSHYQDNAATSQNTSVVIDQGAVIHQGAVIDQGAAAVSIEQFEEQKQSLFQYIQSLESQLRQLQKVREASSCECKAKPYKNCITPFSPEPLPCADQRTDKRVASQTRANKQQQCDEEQSERDLEEENKQMRFLHDNHKTDQQGNRANKKYEEGLRGQLKRVKDERNYYMTRFKQKVQESKCIYLLQLELKVLRNLKQAQV